MTSGASALTIDSYDAFQGLNTSGGASSSSVSDGSILGTEREISITPISGTASSVTVNSGTNPGQISFANGVGSQSSVEILYDGVGTGGFAATDFTSGGADDRFLFNVKFADFTMNLTMEVTSAGGAVSEVSIGTPAPAFGDIPFGILYSSFTTQAGASGAADFSAIESLKMTFDTTVALTDLRLDFLSTADVTEIPPEVSEPGTMAIFSLALIGMAGYRRRLLKTA